MRLLLDESVPVQLRFLFSGHDVQSTRYRGWEGKSNGELLALARDEFDALVTADQAIPDQQSLTSRDVALIVLAARSNGMKDLQPLVPQVLEVLRNLERGRVVRIEARYDR